MTMLFRTIKKSIVDNVLGPNQVDKYRVIGYQDQGRSSLEVLDNKRLVQVYYKEGDFEKRSGRPNGPRKHKMVFNIEMSVAARACGDLEKINDPTSTTEEIAAAINSFKSAANEADEILDEFIDVIYQIISDARSYGLGLEKGIVADTWIGNATKSDPVERGENVVLMAQMRLTCSGSENIKGKELNSLDFIDTAIEINEDSTNNTGVKV